MKTKQAEQKGTYLRAFRAAFPYTVPVLTGYLFIGMAFGVMIQEKGYNFLWAMLMSLVIYAGSGQYLAVNFFAPGVSLFNVIFMEFMVNIRHIFYGLSLLERFSEMGKKRLYMIFSLTDETYSLFFVTKVPKDVKEEQFLFAIAVLDQSYWIIVVIMVEQWMEKQNRPSVVIGLVCGLVCRLVFGADNFILPTMICVMVILLSCKKIFDKMIPEDGKEGGEPECQ